MKQENMLKKIANGLTHSMKRVGLVAAMACMAAMPTKAQSPKGMAQQKATELPSAQAERTGEDDMELWRQWGRPEHVYEYDDMMIRRMPLKVGSRQTAPLACTGSPKVPVVLVQFVDRGFFASGQSDAEVRHSYELFFNGKNNDEVKEHTGSHGSVKQYFLDQSLGQYSPEFVIIGPVTLEKSYAYYGKNDGKSKDVNIRDFYKEALSKCVKEKNVDWTLFDNNGDQKVDMVFFIHAGWGENLSQDNDPNAIWAKESVSGLTVEYDQDKEARFSCYAVCAEAQGKKSDVKEYQEDQMKMDGIGVCLHEMSHALGLPDFYDTNSKAFGMDLWSIMDYGMYGSNGYWPSGYNAYERDFMGWQPLVELTDTTMINVACFADGGVGYKIVNEANEDEYYILENRQPKGWDEKVCGKGKGLQVTHVDYNASRWSNNSVNTEEKHQRMTIIAANNNYNGSNAATDSKMWNECLSGNLFPYTKPSQSLTDTSSPAAEVYAGALMHKPIYDITDNADGMVTLFYLKSQAEYEKELNDALQAQEENAKLDVYDMRGIHLCSCLPKELGRMAFQKGIYVVKFGDGSTRKVMLK